MARTSAFDFTDAPPANLNEFKPLTLSPQQEAIMDWAQNKTGNAIIVAVAGSGKTTTLIEMLSHLSGTVAFAAYNTRIAAEIKEKVAGRMMSSLVNVATFHSFGFRAWRKVHPRVQVDGDKVRNLVRDNALIPEELHEFVTKLVSLVRQVGIGILCPINSRVAWEEVVAHYGLEDLLQEKGRYGTLGSWAPDDDDDDLNDRVKLGMGWALKVLQQSIRMSDTVIDFDEQIYMPLYANAPIEQYDWVLIDEAQDSNPTRRALAKAMLRPGGRFVAVGDPAQAIYGFTGADSESLDNIRDEFGCVELGLTVSYRCPRSVVKLAQTWVSHIEASPTAQEGSVTTSDEESFLAMVPGLTRSELNSSAVLCRKNAPLVGMAFSLIRQGIPCHVEGRDIGASIKQLAKKWKVRDLVTLQDRINKWREDQIRKLMAKGQETRADAIADRCDTVLILIDGLRKRNPGATVSDLIAWVDEMFADNQPKGLTLSSIHKSKGREWETVYWLGSNAYQPSPFARQAWQMQQETNLFYVAATRAKQNLVQVFVEDKVRRGEF